MRLRDWHIGVVGVVECLCGEHEKIFFGQIAVVVVDGMLSMGFFIAEAPMRNQNDAFSAPIFGIGALVLVPVLTYFRFASLFFRSSSPVNS